MVGRYRDKFSLQTDLSQASLPSRHTQLARGGGGGGSETPAWWRAGLSDVRAWEVATRGEVWHGGAREGLAVGEDRDAGHLDLFYLVMKKGQGRKI